MSLNVVLYARVSSQRQAEKQLSISAQLRALRAFAREKEWPIVAEYVDEAKSGRTANRPAFSKMLAAVKYQEIDAVLVWKLDRLARNMEISTAVDAHFRKHGVKVISLHENIDDTPQGKLTARMFESFAEFYSNNLSQDIQRGLREVARRGFFPFAHAPVGYQKKQAEDGTATRYKLVPDTVYAPIITRIFDRYAQGESVPQIVKALNHEGVLTNKGRRWAPKRLYDILRNRIYCGDTTVGRLYLDATDKHSPGDNPVTVEDTHAPLVDKATFERVQEMLDAKSENHAMARWEASPYLLSGLVRCGLCGRHMCGTSAKGGKYHYYTCQQYYHEGKEACRGIRIPKKKLESFVLTRVRDVILDDDNLRTLVEMVNEELQARNGQAEQVVNTVNEQLHALRKRLDCHYDALETGELTIADLAPRIKELRESIARLEEKRILFMQEIDQETHPAINPQAVLTYAKELKQTLKLGSLQERKAFLAGIIKEIRVDEENVQIEYRIPSPQQKTEEPLPSVLQSVTSGGA
ncbi:MAG: recombinase family protein [Candidatus Thorarchaeota archaeon]